MLGKLLIIILLFLMISNLINIPNMKWFRHLKLEHFDEQDLYAYKMNYIDSLRYW